MVGRVGTGDYQYEVVEDWPQIPGSWIFSDVAVDSRGRVYTAVRRPGYPQVKGGAILTFEAAGGFVESWGQDTLEVPHGLWISDDDQLYHADAGDHTVRKYTTSGELLQTLGTPGEIGPPGEPFNRPCRAKLSASGDLYVADGYGQNRVHRMTSEGDIITSWGHGDPVYSTKVGKAATDPGGFNLPHDVTVGDDDRVYVMDRENNRCQVFDNDGAFITEWKDMGYPCDSLIDTNGVMHIVGGGEPGVRLMDLEGQEIGRWTNAEFPGLFSGGPHGMWIDPDESVYIAEVGVENGFHKYARV